MKNCSKTLLLIVSCILATYGKEICPRLCICDIFEGYRRADCSDQNLVSPHINVAKSVEILNLSGNDITTIDDECFADFTELINLSLSRNSIHTIDLFAFLRLNKLNYLDLSDNRLEVIDNRILESNEKLTFLDLSKNKFMMLDDAPLIMSESLEFLSLRNSHLSHIYDSFFSQVPNVVDLDVSNNLLITIRSTVFEPMYKLQFVNFEYNRFSCDSRIESTLQYLKQRKVSVKIDKCVKNSKKPMFEKMIMLTDDVTEKPREDVEIELLWGKESSVKEMSSKIDSESVNMSLSEYYHKIKSNYEDEEGNSEIDCEDNEFFPSLCECQLNFMSLFEKSIESYDKLKENAEDRLQIVFYIGIVLGVIAGCIIFYTLSLVISKCSTASKKQKERQQLRDQMARECIQEIRLAEIAERASPVPAIRRENNLAPPANVQQPRSPIPTPRSTQSRLAGLARESQPSTSRELTVISERPRFEESSTAQLIHKLFRNREQSYSPIVERRSEIVPIFVNPGRHSMPIRTIAEEPAHYTEFPSAPFHNNINDNDDSSEYLSVDNLSLNLEIERSGTPPPPYKDIFN